jgi:hypothetical protein
MPSLRETRVGEACPRDNGPMICEDEDGDKACLYCGFVKSRTSSLAEIPDPILDMILTQQAEERLNKALAGG